MSANHPKRHRRAPFPFPDHAWAPDLDLSADDDTLVAKVDLPGLRPEHVRLAVTDGHLEITGETPIDVDGIPATQYLCERAHGPFYRAIPLPAGVDPEDVTAVLHDGVLEVTVPYPAQSPRAVEIEDRHAVTPGHESPSAAKIGG
jgi:HSP20 family protein